MTNSYKLSAHKTTFPLLQKMVEWFLFAFNIWRHAKNTTTLSYHPLSLLGSMLAYSHIRLADTGQH